MLENVMNFSYIPVPENLLGTTVLLPLKDSCKSQKILDEILGVIDIPRSISIPKETEYISISRELSFQSFDLIYHPLLTHPTVQKYAPILRVMFYDSQKRLDSQKTHAISTGHTATETFQHLINYFMRHDFMCDNLLRLYFLEKNGDKIL